MEFIKIKAEKVYESETPANTPEIKNVFTVLFPLVNLNTIQPAAVAIKTEPVEEDENLRSSTKTKQTSSKHDAGDSLTINAVGQQQNIANQPELTSVEDDLLLEVVPNENGNEAMVVLSTKTSFLDSKSSKINGRRPGRPRKTIIKQEPEQVKTLLDQIKPERESGRPRTAPVRYDPKKEEDKSRRKLRLKRRRLQPTSNSDPATVKPERKLRHRGRPPVKGKINKSPFAKLEISSEKKLGLNVNSFSSFSPHSSSSSASSLKTTKLQDYSFLDNLLKPTDKRHRCSKCPQSFSKREHLKRHELIHTGERPFQCHICKKRFKQNTSLNQHLRTHSKEKPYQCILCKKDFIQQAVLDQHIRKHIGERPYQCKFCEKDFTQQSNLNDHLANDHTFNHRFECSICRKRFSHMAHLKQHLLVHSKPKLIYCVECPEKFPSIERIRRHQELCHQN